MKELRATQNQNQELKEDLDAEKLSRSKADKHRRDLSEELESLKTELEEGMDHATKNTEITIKREQEIMQVKQDLDMEKANFDKALHDARTKHSNQIEGKKT
jgi:myosin protein heavy chain